MRLSILAIASVLSLAAKATPGPQIEYIIPAPQWVLAEPDVLRCRVHVTVRTVGQTVHLGVYGTQEQRECVGRALTCCGDAD